MAKREKPVKVYKLIPIFREEDAVPLDVGEPVVVIGEIRDYVIASIPPGMSTVTAEEVTQGVRAALGKPVLCLTHNIELLAIQEVPRKEAEEILKRTLTESAGVQGGQLH